MNPNLNKVITNLHVIGENRSVMLALAIAAALPTVPANMQEEDQFYITYCMTKTENLVNEINELTLIEYKKVIEKVRDNWRARMHQCYRPFTKLEVKNDWLDVLPELKKDEMQVLKDMHAAIVSLQVSY